MIAWIVLACSEPSLVQPEGPPAPKPARTSVLPKRMLMSFEPVELTEALYTASGPTASKRATIDYNDIAIDFHPLATAGVGNFGARVGASGKALEVCNELDFNAMFEAKGSLWLTSHFECAPGAITLSELEAGDKGDLRVSWTEPVDFSKVGGVFNPCAGQITPWGTHLASEEYEPNAEEEPTSVETHGWDYLSWSKMKEAADGRPLNPYDYGWTPEVAVLTDVGDTLAVKHYAPGRFSHEIAYVLPDGRTTYMSDDGTGSGLFMFVADRKYDLSSGTLYAARYEQDGRGGLMTWLSLGPASNAMVRGWIDSGVTFGDMFEKVQPTGNECPKGFRFVAADDRRECLKLAEPSEKYPNPGAVASRLETRRFAAYMGATTEFQKGEGVTFDPERGILYVAFASVTGRMQAEADVPQGYDHIQVDANPCGAVWSGVVAKGQNDRQNQPIDSDFVLASFGSMLAGTPIEDDGKGNRCDTRSIANPDNITFLPGYDHLMIGEDTKRHAVAALWALQTRSARMTRVMVAPPHGEITGLHWIPELAGHGYLTVAVQHPWKVESLKKGEVALPKGITEEHQRSVVGYLGPFPKLTVE